MAKYKNETLANVSFIGKALSDRNRLRILMALRHRKLCVCQLVGLLNLAPSTVSKHLSILEQARLVEKERYGKFVAYGLPADRETFPVEQVLLPILRTIRRDAVILSDSIRLKEILKMDVEEFCATKLKR